MHIAWCYIDKMTIPNGEQSRNSSQDQSDGLFIDFCNVSIVLRRLDVPLAASSAPKIGNEAKKSAMK